MRGRLLILVAVMGLAVFLNFYNNNRVVQYTRQLSELEKTYNAEKNINTELMVELDDLKSGRHIASLVRVEMMAAHIVTPADGPSFGVAPSGMWMCRSFVL